MTERGQPEPVLDYAAPGAAGPRTRDNTARVAQLLAGAESGGAAGLLAGHLLAPYTGALAFCCVPAPMLVGAVAGVAYKAVRVQVGRPNRWRALAVAGLLVAGGSTSGRSPGATRGCGRRWNTGCGSRPRPATSSAAGTP